MKRILVLLMVLVVSVVPMMGYAEVEDSDKLIGTWKGNLIENETLIWEIDKNQLTIRTVNNKTMKTTFERKHSYVIKGNLLFLFVEFKSKNQFVKKPENIEHIIIDIQLYEIKFISSTEIETKEKLIMDTYNFSDGSLDIRDKVKLNSNNTGWLTKQ